MWKDKNEEVLGFIKSVTDFDTSGDILRLFTQKYCYGFALMLKQAFKDGTIFWDKYNGHAIIKIDEYYYDIKGVYEPNNYSMLRKVNMDILEYGIE